MPQGFVRFPLLNENLINAGACPQCLNHCIAAFNQAVGLSGQPVFFLVCHRIILSNMKS